MSATAFPMLVDVSRCRSPDIAPPIVERHSAPAYSLRQLARAIQRAITDPKIVTPRETSARVVRSLVSPRTEHKHLALA